MTDRQVVLVVEDEPMLRQVVAMTLKVEGFSVIEAGDGREGLEVLKSDEPIDLMLTDVRMPGMNGYELAEASLSIRPSMPVMLMTGFTNDEMPETIRLAAFPMLQKPFNFAKLAPSVREAIASR